MGTTSARKTIVGSLQYLTMISKVAVFCLLATVAHSAPSPDPQIPVGLPVAPSNCVTEYDDIEVQSCAPAPERVCETKTIIHQRITYEQRCKDVTSKHCGGGPVVLKNVKPKPILNSGVDMVSQLLLHLPSMHLPLSLLNKLVKKSLPNIVSMYQSPRMFLKILKLVILKRRLPVPQLKPLYLPLPQFWEDITVMDSVIPTVMDSV